MDRQTLVAFTTIPGLSRPRAAAALKELRESSTTRPSLEDVITSCLRIDRREVSRLADAARGEAAGLLTSAERLGIGLIAWEDDGYPPLLRAIADPPPVLWCRGDIASLSRPAVAIVGSRVATPYAREVASRLAGELAAAGLVVVSGLARGADGAAHIGCLDAGGMTVAVLGSGPDVIYPAEHRSLAASICRAGALVSELGPGGPPLPEHFPLRNRLISGISLGVVVVEASEQSGSLITARYALEQGRDVMAVPGSVLSGRNRGSHALLKDGAKVVESADDILAELAWPVPTGSGREASGNHSNLLKTDQLLERLAVGEPYGLDDLAELTGIPGPRLLVKLTEWELQGKVVRSAGGRFRRPSQTV
jgi:DNA processing protein